MAAARPAAGTSQAGGNGNGAGPGDVVTNIAEFGENLLTLAELQARLAAIELKQNVEAVKVSGAVILAGAVLGIAGLPDRPGRDRRAAGLRVGDEARVRR